MSLEKKLLQLDELIWKQYEKVTQKADAYLGLDKYDLVNICSKLSVGGALGVSVYAGFNSIEQQSVNYGLLSVVYLGLAGFDYFYSPKINELRKKQDQITLQSDLIHYPNFNSTRPEGLILATISYGLGSVFYDKMNNSGLLISLLNFSVGFFTTASISQWYFRDQLPKPPRKDPAKLQQWYNSLKDSISEKTIGAKHQGAEATSK